MISLARRIVDQCLELGADEADAFTINGESISIESRRTQIEIGEKRNIVGIGVRAIVDGGLGFASTHDAHHTTEIARAAVSSAKARGGGEWPGLPTPGNYPGVEDTYDSRVKDVTLDSAVEDMMIFLDAAGAREKATPTSGQISYSDIQYAVVNSNGVEIEDRGTTAYGYMDCIARDGDVVATGQDYMASRNRDIDFEALGKDIAELTESSLGGVKIEPMETAVLLRPQALAGILENTLVPSVNAENVQKGRSALADREGEEIASTELSIIDDGLRPGGMNTSISDDEGVPQQRTPVVEDGVLQGFLYDCEHAGKAGRESTGNANRDSYSSTPGINTTNLTIEYPQSNVVEETREGVIISSVIGAHTANPVSGDFSVEARNAFQVEGGEIKSPIRTLMLSGNVFDLLQGINGAGRDVRDLSGVVTPTIRVEEMRVVG